MLSKVSYFAQQGYGIARLAARGESRPPATCDTLPRFVALVVCTALVKEDRFIRGETSQNGGDDVPRTRKPTFAVADRTASLSSSVI